MNKADILDKVNAILVATIGDRKFCFDIQDIYTTVNFDQARIKYSSANSFAIEIGEESIPLVALGNLFDLVENRSENDSRIIIIEIKNKKVGFFVDSIVEIINFDGRNRSKLELIEDTDFYSYSYGILIYEDEYIYPNLLKIIESIFTQYQN
jgi:chemotaxis signal transduction protein